MSDCPTSDAEVNYDLSQSDADSKHAADVADAVEEMNSQDAVDLLPADRGYEIMADILSCNYTLDVAVRNLQSDYFTQFMERRGWFCTDIDFEHDCASKLKALPCLA